VGRHHLRTAHTLEGASDEIAAIVRSLLTERAGSDDRTRRRVAMRGAQWT
jgi:hypothetical protein